jgi:Fatty acid hydroxylase superfamily
VEPTRHDSPEERSAMLPANYSARTHILTTAVIASGIASIALIVARRAAPIDWLLVPAFFVAANFIEWAVHKNPMHRPLPPRILYKNHTLVHHRAFLYDNMPVNNARELGLIMMPWYTMLGLFIVASPIAVAAALWRGVGAVGIFYFSAALYFIAYEGLHALYHLPDRWLHKLGLGGRLFRAMRAHHTHHHRLDRMSHVNFNVTFPLVDWVMGTRESPSKVPVEAAVSKPHRASA